MNAIVRRDSRPLAGGTRSPHAVRRRDSRPFGGWSNAATGLGTVSDREAYSDFVASYPKGQATVDALLEFNAIGRRIVNREPDDATREGYNVIGGYSAGEVKAIAKAAKSLELLAKVADARRWARGFGGGAILVGAEDGRRTDQPIDYSNLRRIRSFQALDRYEIYPFSWDRNPFSRTFGEAVMYQVSAFGNGGGGTSWVGTVHADRVIRFDGVKLPARRMAARQGWGGSVLDLVWEELKNYGVAHRFAANGVSLITQGVLHMSGLADAIEADEYETVIERLEAIRLSMGILGDLALDKDESYEIHERSFTGLAQLLERLVAALVAATDMPRTVLLGEQPGGLNASADSEIRAWYDHVSTLQTAIYTPAVLRMLELVCRSLMGPTRGRWDEDTAIEWLPLWQESPEEIAKTRLTNAQARNVDKQAGAVSADEIRQDPDLLEHYPGLDPGAPAPPPPPTPGGPPGSPTDSLEDEDEAVAETQGVIIAADPSEMIEGEPLVSALEAARILGYRTGAPVIRMAQRGEFPAWKINGRWKFQASSVRDAVARMHVNADAAREDRAPLPLG